jgi:hypothetical protein
MSSRPPASSMRSRMPVRPCPGSTAARPRPSSTTSTRTRVCVTLHRHPHLAGSRMPQGVGESFLHATQHGLGLGHFVDPQLASDLQGHLRTGQALGQGAQGGTESSMPSCRRNWPTTARMSSSNPSTRSRASLIFPGRSASGRRKASSRVSFERGQAVPSHIVQFTRQAQALAIACTGLQQAARGEQVGIDLGQFVTLPFRGVRQARRQQGEELEPGIHRRGEPGVARCPSRP